MTVRGWCPGVYEPMATGDGLLVRVKPRGGVLTAAAARIVAGEAAAFGNGVVELTGRGNLQVRGLSPEGVAPFARAMVAAGLAHANGGAERRRTVIGTPLAGVDPGVSAGTRGVVEALERALEADRGLESMAAKFAFVVDGGGVLPPGVSADVRVRVFAAHAEISCAGGGSAARVAVDDVVPAALRLAQGAAGRRMRQDVEARGEAAVLAAAGLSGGAASPVGEAGVAVGAVGGVAFGVGLVFGSASAEVWAALAEVAERYGDGMLRLTPWRAVLIGGDVSALRRGVAGLGLITEAEDARRRVFACPGEPACASASVVTRGIASKLRPPAGTTVHVSGCEKGCAHPGVASVTFVGRGGRFDLVREGRAGDAPERRGLSAAEVR